MITGPISLVEPHRPRPRWKLDRSQPPAAAELEFDDSQLAVINHRAGALLVLAGPGTGKTATLTESVAQRLAGPDALDPSQILVLTFARKAAAEIRDRILKRVGSGLLPTVSTFHSLALGIVREFDASEGAELRLLTAPEQQVVVQEVLRSLIEEPEVANQVHWPASLTDALPTNGIAVEIRNAFARARALGLEPAELLQIARAAGQPEWIAVAELLEQYLDSSEQSRMLDYSELIYRAAELAGREQIQSQLRQRFRAVYVDEYQDTDPLQVQLLQSLVAADATLIAVGDPDQSIYGFRGADPIAIRQFATDFAHNSVNGGPRLATLKVTRRTPANIRQAALRVIERSSSNLLPAGIQSEHRQLETVTAGGVVTLSHYENADVEAEQVADSIRQRVLTSGGELSWRDVAVLVRSGSRSIPLLERALLAADVPVATAYDDLPLGQEPAVVTLLSALRCAARPDLIRVPEVARDLLASPLAELGPAELRNLARLLRDANGGFSEEALAAGLADARAGLELDPDRGGHAWQQLVKLRDLLGRAHSRYVAGADVHELLWLLWQGTSWPERLRQQVLNETSSAASAGHDLDCVTTLMELAAATSAAGGKRRGQLNNFVLMVQNLLVPAVSHEPSVSPNAVSIMTAHRAKGLEWPVVYICSADEGTWPDLRRRSSIFEPDRLYRVDGDDSGRAELGGIPERSGIVEEERRLFYVACTRAKRELHVSSTSLDRESGRLASRFTEQLTGAELTQLLDNIDELKPDAELKPQPRHSATALVAALRRLGTEADASPELRAAVAQRLARLARITDAQAQAAVPAANPHSWWGMAAATASAAPIDAPDQPLYIRGSSLERLQDCSLAWYLEQRAMANEPSSAAMVFGNVVHALAGAVVRGELPPDIDEVAVRLDAVWPKLKYESQWLAQRERLAAADCVSRFLVWLAARPADVVKRSSEVDFNGVWTVHAEDGTTDTVRLRGSVDIVEIRSDGGHYIVDLKTAASPVTVADAERNPQLGMYQAAANQGLLSEVPAGHAAGAELLYLRIDPKRGNVGAAQRSQPPLPATVGNWLETGLAAAAQTVRSERFDAVRNPGCDRCQFKSLCPLFPAGGELLP